MRRRKADMVMRTGGVAVAMLFVAAGCTQPNPAFDADPFLPGECRSGVETSEVIANFERPEKLDVLFVVDSSGDVDDLQKTLAGSIGQLTTLLERIDVDARIAVATTDASRPPELAPAVQEVEGCEDNTVVVAKSSSSSWGEAVACNVQQGEEGNGFDQPLRVVDGLLEGGAGDDFLRSDARLLIMVVTKDDDCSSEEPLSGIPRETCPDSDHLVDADAIVDGWIADRVVPESIGLAVFAGPPSDEPRAAGRPVCSSTVGTVYPANRLFRAVSRFGDYGFFHSVCTDDFSGPFASVMERFVGQAEATFCPTEQLAHEPLSVVLDRADEQESVEMGDAGFVYLGHTERCPQGAIRFDGELLRDVEEVSLEYCMIPTD